MYYGRNPFKALNDLPDTARVGVNLMFGGLVLTGFRFGWESFAPASFHNASKIFLRWEPYIPHRYSHGQLSAEDFGVLLVIIASLLFIGGAFIFFRRGFWWVAEHRSEPEVTDLKFK